MCAGNFLSPKCTSPQVCIPSNVHARYDESEGTTNNKKTNIKNLKKPYSRECCAIFLICTTQKPMHFSLSNDMQQPQIHKKSPKVPLWSSHFHIWLFELEPVFTFTLTDCLLLFESGWTIKVPLVIFYGFVNWECCILLEREKHIVFCVVHRRKISQHSQE